MSDSTSYKCGCCITMTRKNDSVPDRCPEHDSPRAESFGEHIMNWLHAVDDDDLFDD